MRNRRAVSAVLCAVLLGTGATASTLREPVAAQEVPGSLVTATVVERLSRQAVTAYLAGYSLDTSAVRNGVDLHVVTYRTPGVDGRPTTASALIVLPATGERSLRTVTWLHGTRVSREDTATQSNNTDRAVTVLFASAGFATVAPDYLGLGAGSGTHPYMLSEPTANASLDALRVARTLAARSGTRLDRRVLVSGFSQGGQTSMIVGRALQRSADFELGAVAAIAGPLDIRGHELPAALDGRIDGGSAVLYLAYATTAWQRVYGDLYESPSQVYRAPYHQVVESLFDGDHDVGDIAAALPATPAELFTDEYLTVLAHPSGALARVHTENDDPCAWRPTAPVRLYAGAADRDVVLGNSVSCQEQLVARGVTDSRFVHLGDVGHFGTLMLALPDVLAFFTDQD